MNILSIDDKKLVEKLKETFDLRQFEVKSANFGRAIQITGKGKAYGTDVWIRLERQSELRIFNINNIQVVDKLKNKGILTSIVHAAIKSNCIDVVNISSVVSDEMHNWCRKRNWHYEESTMTYYINTSEYML